MQGPALICTARNIEVHGVQRNADNDTLLNTAWIFDN